MMDEKMKEQYFVRCVLLLKFSNTTDYGYGAGVGINISYFRAIS
jgi:hypothetical protein